MSFRLSPLTFVVILTISGCITDGDPVGPTDQEVPVSGIRWNETLENQTLILHVTASSNLTVRKNMDVWPDHKFRSAFMVLGYFPVLHGRVGPSPTAVVQEHQIHMEGYASDQALNRRETLRSYPPGDHLLVLQSWGTKSTFSVMAENGTVDLVAHGEGLSDRRTYFDDGWDHHIWMKAGPRQYYHASTHVPLDLDRGLLVVVAKGGSGEITIEPGCQLSWDEFESAPTPSRAMWAVVHDNPVKLEARFHSLGTSAGFFFHTTQIPAPLETGCWEWKEWSEQYREQTSIENRTGG